MYVKLRILFTLLSVACAAVVFPVGTLFGFTWAIICVMACALFAGLMYLCKQKQEADEERAKNADNTAEQTADVATPNTSDNPDSTSPDKNSNL